MIASLVMLLSVAWVLAIVASPALPTLLATAMYVVGSRICHQYPDRSFHLLGAQLAVCARCTGIYAGVAIGACTGRWVWTEARTRILSPRWLLVVAAAPTAMTWASEWAGAWTWSNQSRAIAGLPLGIAVGLVVMKAVATLHYDGCGPRPPIATNRRSIPT